MRSTTTRLLAALPVVAFVIGGTAFLLLRSDSSGPHTRLARSGALDDEGPDAIGLLGRSAREVAAASETRLGSPTSPSGPLAGGSSATATAAKHVVVAAATEKSVAGHANPAARPQGPKPTREASAAEIARIRAGLHDLDPKVRLASLRAARDLHLPELEADAALVLQSDSSTPCRRVATQILAQGDAASHEGLLRGALKDPDPVIDLNATFGLARAGDESQQAVLLVQCEVARKQTPGMLVYVATMLEDPTLRSPAVIERFKQLSQNPAVAPATRARALDVLRAKGS